jgi:hypothetical protein
MTATSALGEGTTVTVTISGWRINWAGVSESPATVWTTDSPDGGSVSAQRLIREGDRRSRKNRNSVWGVGAMKRFERSAK